MSRTTKRVEEMLRLIFSGASNSGPPLIGVSYERVSHKKQVDGTSLETQPADIERWAQHHGITIVQHYVDRGRSGRTTNRAEYQRMLAELSSQRVQVVLVWKLDRFARNMLLQLQKIEEFSHLGVALVSITEMIDYTTAMGKQMLAQSAMYAQAYSDQLSERMERALRHTAERGFWVGPVPFGYARAGKREPLQQTDDAAVVHEIFQRYATGMYSDTTLSDQLNREGYTALDWRSGERRPFTREGIRWILRNRVYIGMVTSGGNEYAGNHTPIISQVLWNACAALRQRRSTDNIQTVQTHYGLLHAIGYCAHCSAPLWQHGSYEYRYYRCSKVRDAQCGARMSRIAVIDTMILELVGSLVLPDSLIERVKAIMQEDTPAPQRMQPDPAALEAQRERLNKLYVLGRLSDAEYEVQYEALQPTRQDQTPMPQLDIDGALRFLKHMPSLIEQANHDERRELVGSLFSRVWVDEKTIAAITPHQVYSTILEAVKAATVHNLKINCVVGVADGHQQPATHNLLSIPIWPASGFAAL